MLPEASSPLLPPIVKRRYYRPEVILRDLFAVAHKPLLLTDLNEHSDKRLSAARHQLSWLTEVPATGVHLGGAWESKFGNRTSNSLVIQYNLSAH